MPQSATITTRTALVPTRGRRLTDRVDRAVEADVQSVNVHGDADCISVDLLGGLRVRAGGTTMGPRDLGGTKPRRVLLALLLQRGCPVSKERLVSLLWEGTPPKGAKATLEAYVCVLRKKLQPHQAARASLITTVAGCYAIDMTRVDLDVLRYEGLMSAALQDDTSATAAMPMLLQAMALAESPLLPEEVDSEWLDEARRSHKENVRKARIAAACKITEMRSGSSEQWARLALESDSLDESAWLALLKSMEANGHHADGLQAYDTCRKLFAAELGCAPGPGLQELYARLLRGASESDGELSQLLDAVVKLHMASHVSAQSPVVARGSGRRDTIGQGSVDQAWRALDVLLRNVGGRRHNLAGALGA